MSVAVTMRGLLEPVILDEEFVDTINSMSIAGAQGKPFIIGPDMEGNPVAVAIANVLVVRDNENEDAFIG